MIDVFAPDEIAAVGRKIGKTLANINNNKVNYTRHPS